MGMNILRDGQEREIVGRFALEGCLFESHPYGNGHINDTFLVIMEEAGARRRYILQRINHQIFERPWELMENMVNVTEYLRGMIARQGGDAERGTLRVIETADGKSYYRDGDGNYWRMFPFIEHSVCLEKVESAKDFYDSAVAFGNFQRMLADFPAEKLHETIRNFHHTPTRFQAFLRAVKEDKCKRVGQVGKEIYFVLEREQEASMLTDLLEAGELPLRVTHNDTKLNNILFDETSRKALCIIDLDTIMPGLAHYDYGDSIRFGASTAEEDETDIRKVELDLSLFEAFTKGFLEGCGGSLTDREIELLPMGAKLMTFECGIRFLTDYLEGDTYFKIHREGHNLDRARTQLKLVADMEMKWDQMRSIVEKCQKACAAKQNNSNTACAACSDTKQ